MAELLLPYLPVRMLQSNTGDLIVSNETSDEDVLVLAEEEHTFDAEASLLLNLMLIACLMIAYYVKRFRIYYLPESAGALLVGVFIGGLVRWSTDALRPFEFSPEMFFFILLPPIIFEAGYSINKKDFLNNVGAITLYAMVGTLVSTFIVGGLTFQAARAGLIANVDQQNPMEALLFGALISAVDPVATLSIMGNAELGCDKLVYSLVFGESVLNDAIAISLFKVFAKYYDPKGPNISEAHIPAALLSFIIVSILSILVGIGVGLAASFMYKHTMLSNYPQLETSLLFCICYLCYAAGEALGLSGIMALFFQGMVLSHYNSYNLSATAHVASEHIFMTLATISETAVFLYMGMGVFTGRFENYDILFSVLALSFCALGRLLNIFPLSWVANLCRKGRNRIPFKMQIVLWFAGLRGAIAFALAVNMPGPNREVYATATLFICIFTTVVCGGLTDHMLTRFGMKQRTDLEDLTNGTSGEDDSAHLTDHQYSPVNTISQGELGEHPFLRRTSVQVYKGSKRLWKQFDDEFLKPNFGGSNQVPPSRRIDDPLGDYELGKLSSGSSDDSDRGIHNKDEDLSIGSDFRPPKRNAARAVSGGSNQSSSRGPTIVGIR